MPKKYKGLCYLSLKIIYDSLAKNIFKRDIASYFTCNHICSDKLGVYLE